MKTEHRVQQTSERRTFVTAVVAAAAGVLGTVLAGIKRAEAGHDGSNIFHIRESNDGGTQTTSLIARTGFSPALLIQNLDGGQALQTRGTIFAIDDLSAAIQGVFNRPAPPVVRIGTGVFGSSPGQLTGQFASQLSRGNAGVIGIGEHQGVRGVGFSTGAAVQAEHLQGGVALDVMGKASFSTAGQGSIPAGTDSATVQNSTVTVSSHITVTLTDDPGMSKGKGGQERAAVAWVERDPSVGFTVHLTRDVAGTTGFTYLIVEPR